MPSFFLRKLRFARDLDSKLFRSGYAPLLFLFLRLFLVPLCTLSLLLRIGISISIATNLAPPSGAFI